MTPTSASRILCLAVGGPVVIATAAVLTFAGFELRGRTLLSDGPVRNVAEAASLGQASEVVRLMYAGQDPNRVWPVPKDMISSTVTQVTALEAAVWSRRVQLVELFDRQGAIADADTRRYLTCLAADLEPPVTEIIEYLSPQGAGFCEAGQTIAVVRERTSS